MKASAIAFGIATSSCLLFTFATAADLTNEVAAGDVVEAKYTGVDRKARIVHLSVKAKDQAEEAAAVANVNTKQEDVAIPNAMAEAFKAAKGE